MTVAPDERFWGRVRPSLDGCLEWTGSKKPNGYGQFTADGRCYVAHRWLYEQRVGPIPAGMQLDHLCRNRSCVRLEHLEVVTPRENQHRGDSFSGINARKTHCPKGHPFDAGNTIIRSNQRAGRRECRACKNERRRVDKQQHH